MQPLERGAQAREGSLMQPWSAGLQAREGSLMQPLKKATAYLKPASSRLSRAPQVCGAGSGGPRSWLSRAWRACSTDLRAPRSC